MNPKQSPISPSAAHLAPYLAIVAGIAIYSLMDTTMKFASLAIGAYSATFWRSTFGFILVFPLWLREGPRWPDRAPLRLHIVRGMVAAGIATTFFYGLVRLPFAEAIAISFIAPLIALGLAALILGEKIEREAVVASLLGLVGVGIICFSRLEREHTEPDVAWGIAAVLVSACLYAWNLILQRQQAKLAKPLEVATFQNAAAALTLACGAPWLLIVPSADAWLSTGASALLAVLALMLTSWAYGRAEAQAMVPFEYTAFLWAALLGWIAFSEKVTVPTLIGAVLIVAGCWIAAPRKHIEQTAL